MLNALDKVVRACVGANFFFLFKATNCGVGGGGVIHCQISRSSDIEAWKRLFFRCLRLLLELELGGRC